jgi:hypothetical protein
MAAKWRTDMLDLLFDTMSALDKSEKNTEKYRVFFDKMSDQKFKDFSLAFFKDPKQQWYLEVEPFVSEPSFEDVEDAAKVTGTQLFDYVAFPYLSDDPSKPIWSVNKIFVIALNMRRVQQFLYKKNSTSISIDSRNPVTGQVSGNDKNARLSDMELYALTLHQSYNVLAEFFGPKADDEKMKNDMLYDIATTGRCSLEKLKSSKDNKIALNTLSNYFLAAGIQTDLVAKGNVLPRTLKVQFKDAKIIDRKEGSAY